MPMHGRIERNEMTSLGYFSERPDGGRVEWEAGQ
jgi:hypothetical protein